MPALVSNVVRDSIADELSIEGGDIILSIDNQVMQDMIDYMYLCKTENLVLKIQNGLL